MAQRGFGSRAEMLRFLSMQAVCRKTTELRELQALFLHIPYSDQSLLMLVIPAHSNAEFWISALHGERCGRCLPKTI